MMLKTASSHHKKCFVCERKNEFYMKVVSIKSVYLSYVRYKIVIKPHARCCKKHLDENGDLMENEFLRIKTKEKEHSSSYHKLLHEASKNFFNQTESCCIFDKFTNLETLSEIDCKIITGWSKDQFLEFCSHVKIKRRKERTKEELIAIYRYWLRKGIDQTTLSLLRNDTTQSQISNYLSYIRIAINRDFVPKFLGPESRTREFFISHNTQTFYELFDLNKKEDILAIVADATYARIEHSANNELQSNSWSSQKKQNITKPFLICLTDGYILDIYTNNKGKVNDASILRHILRTQEYLVKNILLPHKTHIFIDRGFRDIVNELKTKYGFITRTPYIKELEKKSEIENSEEKPIKELTTFQCSETRLATKVRNMWVGL